MRCLTVLILVLASTAVVAPAVAQPPATPGAFGVAPVACTDMLLSWSDVADETAYLVFRDGSFAPLMILSADVTSYLDPARIA